MTRYVISHTGKPGGPWEAVGDEAGTATASTNYRAFWHTKDAAERWLPRIRRDHPDAKLMRLVPSKRRALRDAVVEAAMAYEDAALSWTAAIELTTGERIAATQRQCEAADRMAAAVRALRAHERGE